ncbi:MAG TPA: biotin--[acetyl-CoA-carboxylase] ligase [Immundisolibacter sp.]|nr:biotin--[acetyl-CoA-carboxylase] ligase [Immundisolibacter sp.]
MSPPSATSLALLRLLADGGWHSGVELAQQLGLSRAAVWKQVQGLSRWGVAVHTQRAHGYRLSPALDLLDSLRLRLALTGIVAPDELEVFDSLPSTNAHLIARIGAGRGTGVCLAEHQSAGRGRRGRAWHSPFGRNLYLSVAQAYEAGPAALAGLSLAIGAALAQLLTALGIAGVGLKWPNDLLCGGRKLGGILIELQGDTQGPCWAVAGIGLNVNMDVDDGPSIDQPWTSLLRLAGGSWDRTALAAQVVSSVRQVMSAFPGDGLAPWLGAYAQFDLLAGCPVDVDWAGEHICGVARGIDASGALLVDCAGARRALWGGEVTVRAARGSAV